MAAAMCTHSTVGVADLCQHSLPSTALVDASSRSPLERNKRETLYTLMTFPQWLSKTTAPLKLLWPGWGWRRVPTAHQRKGNTECTVCPLGEASQREGIIRSLCGMVPTVDSLTIVPTTPSLIPVRLFLWIQHIVTLRHPQNQNEGLCIYMPKQILTRQPVNVQFKANKRGKLFSYMWFINSSFHVHVLV